MWPGVYVVDKGNYIKQFGMTSFDKKESVAIRVRRFRLKLFSVLSETVFAHIVSVSNQNENAPVSLDFFGSKRNGFFCSHFSRFERK
jgi:hypothetical protein